jgi:tRNA(His) 5'-end guanylyltransferase
MNKNSDEFGNRMKFFERAYTDVRIPINVPLCVRIDGKGFSKFTKGFTKPFDSHLTQAMIDTTKHLVKETNANIGYTQSDEITLIWFQRSEKQNEHIFGGKVSKINSILASMASAAFNHYIEKYSPILYAGKGLAYFDCRAWSVPNDVEASNVLLWRIQDAKKNSISSLYRWTLGYSTMHGLSGTQMIEKLKSSGTDWEKLSATYRYGVCVRRKPRMVELDSETLAKIPVDKQPENAMVMRNEYVEERADKFAERSLKSRVTYIKGY